MNKELFQIAMQMVSNSRPFTKEEAAAHSRVLEKSSTVVKCLYPEINKDKPVNP